MKVYVENGKLVIDGQGETVDISNLNGVSQDKILLKDFVFKGDGKSDGVQFMSGIIFGKYSYEINTLPYPNYNHPVE
jgi:hypothetical protein